MLFFRSEDCVRAWCKSNQYPVRPIVSIPQLWALSEIWYSTRLDAEADRPPPGEVRAIFEGIGLVGDFWDPTIDDANE